MGKLTGKTALVTGASGASAGPSPSAWLRTARSWGGGGEAAATKTAAAIKQACGRAFIVGAELAWPGMSTRCSPG